MLFVARYIKEFQRAYIYYKNIYVYIYHSLVALVGTKLQ